MWKFLLGSYGGAAPVTLGLPGVLVWFCKHFYSFPWGGAELFAAFPVPVFPTSHLSLPSTGTFGCSVSGVDSKSQQNSQFLPPSFPSFEPQGSSFISPEDCKWTCFTFSAALIWEFRYPKKNQSKGILKKPSTCTGLSIVEVLLKPPGFEGGECLTSSAGS